MKKVGYLETNYNGSEIFYEKYWGGICLYLKLVANLCDAQESY